MPSNFEVCEVCKDGFGEAGSGGGVARGGGGTKPLTTLFTPEQFGTPKAPGILHGGEGWVLFVPDPPESMHSQSVRLSGVNVALTREGDGASLSRGVAL